MSILLLAVSFPSFDWQAAVLVGIIVAAATATVILIAIATPPIALTGGTSYLGTALAIGAISLVTGVVGGAAAGLIEGHQFDTRVERIRTYIRDDVAQILDIRFLPSEGDKDFAAPYQCELVSYRPLQFESDNPGVQEHVTVIHTSTDDMFYGRFETELRKWLQTPPPSGDNDTARRVRIFMHPEPGENVYNQLKLICQRNNLAIVERHDTAWKTAISEKRLRGE